MVQVSRFLPLELELIAQIPVTLPAVAGRTLHALAYHLVGGDSRQKVELRL